MTQIVKYSSCMLENMQFNGQRIGISCMFAAFKKSVNLS